MKSLLIEKSLIIVGVISILFTFKPSQDTLKPTIKKDEYKIDATLKKDASLNTDSILNDAKATVEAYNKSVKEKNLINSVLVKLTKKELSNAKQTNKLIQLLIKKYSSVNKDTNISESSIKIDSVCNKKTSYLFGKNKCTEWKISIFLLKDNKKLLIQELKTKP